MRTEQLEFFTPTEVGVMEAVAHGNVRAWKDLDAPTYIVQVGEHMYEMNTHANRPDGVCQYVGRATDLAWTVRDKPVPVRTLPLGIVEQVAKLMEREK